MMHTIVDTINSTEFKDLQVSRLIEVDANQIVSVTMEKGAHFPKHDSKTDVTLLVLEGKITFYISEQEYLLSKHQVFQFPKDEEHHVTAHENSRFLLIK